MEALTAPQIQAKGLAHERAEPCALTFARADPEKLEQILLNLLSDAIKLTEAGGGVTVECAYDGERVRLATPAPASLASGWPTSSNASCRWTPT